MYSYFLIYMILKKRKNIYKGVLHYFDTTI